MAVVIAGFEETRDARDVERSEPAGTNRRFALTWDYRGRFARHLSEHVVVGLVDGADWEVEFRPFSVEQTRRADGRAPIWDDPGASVSVLAMQVGLVVRDRYPEHFLPVHAALFAARHDEGLDLRQEPVLRQVLVRHNVDPDDVFNEVAGGAPLETYRREHERSVAEYGVFGVPTLIADGRAAFVRLMQGPMGDPGSARRTVESLLDLVVGWPELNELRHTTQTPYRAQSVHSTRPKDAFGVLRGSGPRHVLGDPPDPALDSSGFTDK